MGSGRLSVKGVGLRVICGIVGDVEDWEMLRLRFTAPVFYPPGLRCIIRRAKRTAERDRCRFDQCAGSRCR